MTEAHTQSWHYPRTALALNYLDTLSHGAPTLAIFAERRKGKTEFLTHDMTPVAINNGHRCCYVNFWEDRSNPIACIVNGVDRSLQSESGSALRGWKKEVSVNLGALQAKLTQAADATIQTANAALNYLLKPTGTVLLMCDEVQHLATRSEFEDITASLRTFIDSNKHRVRTIFTGSSQNNLNRLFKNQRAAFYNSASIVPFPDMGSEFIEFLSRRFQYLSGRDLPPESIMPTFVKHHRSPAFIVELLQVMVRDGFFTMESGIQHYFELNPPDEDNEQTWNKLSALEQELIKHLAKLPGTPLYHPEQYRKFSTAIGVNIGQGAVQAALNRLRDQDILINSGRGQWEFESTRFKTFAQEQQD